MGEAYLIALSERPIILREAFARHGGVEVSTKGDAVFAVFRSATEAVAAAAEVQTALRPGRIWVRMGLHTGEPFISGGDYVGLDVHLAARIAASEHGGQVSSLPEHGSSSHKTFHVDLGTHAFKDFDEPVQLFQFGDDQFPPRIFPTRPYPGRAAFSLAGSARFPKY